MILNLAKSTLCLRRISYSVSTSTSASSCIVSEVLAGGCGAAADLSVSEDAAVLEVDASVGRLDCGFFTDFFLKLPMPVSSFDLAVVLKLPVAVVVVNFAPDVTPGAARRDAVFLAGASFAGEVMFSCAALTGLRTPVVPVVRC